MTNEIVTNPFYVSNPTSDIDNYSTTSIIPVVPTPTTTANNLVAINSIMPTATVGDIIAAKNNWLTNGWNWFSNKMPNTAAGMSDDWAKVKEVGGHYKTGYDGLTTSQKASGLLQSVGTVMDALNTRKQLKLAKQSLNHTIANDNRNFEMAKRSYNSNLEDRQRYREAYWKANNAGNLDTKPLSVNDYLNKYGA